jgi:hypothetical protein
VFLEDIKMMNKLSENTLFFIKACSCIIATFLIAQVARTHCSPGTESAIWISSFAILLSVSMFWEMRRSFRFWIVVCVAVVLHVLLALAVRWPIPPPESGRSLGFIAALDAGSICGVLSLVKKSKSKKAD